MNTKIITRLGLAAAGLGATAALTACGSGGGTATAASDGGGDGAKPTLVIGQQQSGIVSLVKDSHALDGAPYNVKWAVFPFGPPLVAAAAAGQIDLGDVGDVPPINGAAKDLGFKVIAAEVPPSFKQAGNYLVVPKGSQVRTIADLRGKKVGVPVGSAAHGFLLNAVKSVGLVPDKDVTFVNLAPAALQVAFNSGKVDAASIWNPQAALDVLHGGRIVAKGVPPLDPDVGFYVGSSKTLADPKRRALLTDLLKRLGRAYAWGTAHPDVWIKDVQKETGIDPETAKIQVDNGKLLVKHVSPEILRNEQHLADTFFAAHQITKKVDVATIVDNLLPRDFTGQESGR
jgi:sulfonate transport system substrate-binding protein